MKALLTGGAGYIGSHTALALLEQETAKIPHSSSAGDIIIADCSFEQAGTSVPLVILKRVPSCFLFRNNTFKGQKPRLFDWQVKKMDQKYFLTDSYPGGHQGVPWSVKHKYQFIFGRNSNVDINLPEIIKQFVHKEVPQLFVKPEKMPGFPDTFKGKLEASAFGVKADGRTDDAAALEKAMAAAAKAGKILLLPSGKIRVARTVRLPEKLFLHGTGMTTICGDTRSGYDLFSAENPVDIRFRNLFLRMGRHILKGKLNKNAKLVSFCDVLITDTDRLSILLEGKNNSCRLDLTGSLWNGAGGIDSSARYNSITLCWFATNFWMDDMAFFTARQGTTHIQNGFFVPYVAKNIKRRNRRTGEVRIWPLGGNLRWVDNCGGKVFMYDCRGGGEGGGYCHYFHTAPGGFGVIEGGRVRMTNKFTKHTIIYAKAAPEWMLLAAVGGNPIHTLQGVRQYVWLKADEKVPDFPVYILGSMTPQEK